MNSEPLLSVQNLGVSFNLEDDEFNAISELSFDLEVGKTLGLVGESGSGKSLTALSLLRLIPPPGDIISGQIFYQGNDILNFESEPMRSLRGNDIAMIFQEPTTALNPVLTIGEQIAEPLLIHRNLSREQAIHKATEMLERVGIPDATSRMLDYPHSLSGGMRQRVVIAMALICEPKILIADEATTALDTTVQAQILDLLMDLQEEFNMAILFISHNLAVVSEIADDVMVMYGGRLMEMSPASVLFEDPQHPYTKGLLATLPTPDMRGHVLPTIEGNVANRYDLISGCRFAPRCGDATDHCHISNVPVQKIKNNRAVSCLNLADAP